MITFYVRLCTLVKRTKFAVGHIARTVMIGFTQPRYQIKSREFLFLLSLCILSHLTTTSAKYLPGNESPST